MAILFAFISTVSLADPLLYAPSRFFGTGCSVNTSSYILSHNHSRLSILFDRFDMQSVSLCQIEIPIKAQNRTSIRADYLGHYSLPVNTSLSDSRFYSGYPFLNIKADSVFGPENRTYNRSDVLSMSCNESIILRLLLVFTISNNHPQENATGSLNRIDLSIQPYENQALDVCGLPNLSNLLPSYYMQVPSAASPISVISSLIAMLFSLVFL